MSSLKGKVALITGASSGIGREISRKLAALGCKLVLVARNQDRLQALADDLGGDTIWIAADLGDGQQIKGAIDRAIATFETIDILVENAAVFSNQPLTEMPADDVRQMVDINFTGVVQMAQAALVPMIRQGSGDILVIGSIAGISDMRNEAVYSATKHAVNAFVRSLRRQVAPNGVRVGSILPGTVATELWGDIDPVEVDRKVAAGEVLRPTDIADIATFLLQRPRNVAIREIVVLPHSQDI